MRLRCCFWVFVVHRDVLHLVFVVDVAFVAVVVAIVILISVGAAVVRHSVPVFSVDAPLMRKHHS